MSEDVSVEAAGETVGEAKWAAVRELERLVPGLDRAAVRFQVVTEGERGLLGVGYAPARVVATTTPAAPAPPTPPTPAEGASAEAARAREAVERVVAGVGAECGVTLGEDGESIVVTLTGSDVGLLIGRHGQTIDGIQYLANAIARATFGPERRRVVVDAAGYRARRTQAVETLARRAAEQAAATGRRVALEPMTAIERKIVHEHLKDDPEVETLSEGTEPHRCIVVVPRRSAD